MEEIANKFFDQKLQPQIFSLILITIILIILAIIIYIKASKQKVNKAPKGILLLAEQYVSGIDNLYKDITGNKITKPAPYIFTLITMLFLGNILGLVGLEPPATSYSFTLVIGLISWIGIYVVGIMHQKFRFFKKFLNPIELIGQFSPLISLSFRLFGNLLGGATIMFLIYRFTGWIWSFIPVIGSFNLLGPVIAWAGHAYFDIFGGLIQAFVFSLLTMVYWTLEAEVHESAKEINEKKVVKESKIIEGIALSRQQAENKVKLN